MSMLRWIVGGLIGAAAGILIWAAVGYFANYEVGWIAWLVGFLVGLGVRYAAYQGDQDEGAGQGILAAVMAIGAIFAAKFLVFTMLTGGAQANSLSEVFGDVEFNDEAMIAGIADEIAQEMIDRGQRVNWPPGMSYEEASGKDDYPAEIWRQAETRWNQFSGEEQEEQKRQLTLLVGAFAGELSKPSFGDFFSPWDLLWFGLATVTAYRIGVGTYGDD